MNLRRSIPLFFVGVLTYASCSSLAVAASTVNGEKITESQVETELERVRSDPRFQDLLSQQAEQVRGFARRQILNGLIRQTVLGQQARKRGIRATDQEVERLIAEETQRVNLTLEDYLAQQKLSRADLEVLARRVATELALRERVIQAPDVTDAQVADFYEKNRSAFEQVHLSRITVKTKDDASEVRDELRSADFAAVARQRSIDDLKNEGGEMGYLPLTELGPVVQAAVARVKAGEVTEPVPTAFGFEVYRVEDKRTSSLDDVSDEIRTRLADQLRQAKFETWVADRIRGAKVVVNPKYGRFDRASAQVVSGTGVLRG